MRLLRILQNYKAIEDESKELNKIKKRLVLGYTFFFLVTIAASFIYAYALLRRLLDGMQ